MHGMAKDSDAYSPLTCDAINRARVPEQGHEQQRREDVDRVVELAERHNDELGREAAHADRRDSQPHRPPLPPASQPAISQLGAAIVLRIA
jgi:hypothetical protein